MRFRGHAAWRKRQRNLAERATLRESEELQEMIRGKWKAYLVGNLYPHGTGIDLRLLAEELAFEYECEDGWLGSNNLEPALRKMNWGPVPDWGPGRLYDEQNQAHRRRHVSAVARIIGVRDSDIVYCHSKAEAKERLQRFRRVLTWIQEARKRGSGFRLSGSEWMTLDYLGVIQRFQTVEAAHEWLDRVRGMAQNLLPAGLLRHQVDENMCRNFALDLAQIRGPMRSVAARLAAVVAVSVLNGEHIWCLRLPRRRQSAMATLRRLAKAWAQPSDCQVGMRVRASKGASLLFQEMGENWRCPRVDLEHVERALRHRDVLRRLEPAGCAEGDDEDEFYDGDFDLIPGPEPESIIKAVANLGPKLAERLFHRNDWWQVILPEKPLPDSAIEFALAQPNPCSGIREAASWASFRI